MRKILYIRTDLCNEELIAGGSVAHTIGVIKGFAHQGWRVFVASSIMHRTLGRALAATPFVFVEEQLCNRWIFSFLRWRINCLLSNIYFYGPLVEMCRWNKPEYLYQRYSLLNFVGVRVSQYMKIPLILEYNGSEVWIDKNWAQQKWFNLSRLAQRIEDYNLKHAQHIVVVSKALRDELIERDIDPEKIIVVPNGVDTDLYDPAYLAPEREYIRENELDTKQDCIFGFAGTFSVWHGINIIAKMIPDVCAYSPRAHFLLIGDGPLKAELEERVRDLGLQDRVTFTGLVCMQEAREYLSACDIFLCPTQPNEDGSRFFGSPTKLFEYLSLGKPIIASRLEQVAEIMDTKDPMGILVDPYDVDGFIKAACTLLESDRANMGSAARERACAQYTWKSHVETIIKQVGERVI